MERFSAFRADLVDLVYVYDADLRAADVEVGGRDQLQQYVLDVLAHVARLGEGGCVGYGEGHLQGARQRLGQQGLARPGGPQQHDVRLVHLDAVVVARRFKHDALVVVVHGDGERTLGRLLTHDVLGQVLVYLVRGGQRREHFLACSL